MSEVKDFNWLKTKEDIRIGNFEMVSIGYVAEMVNYQQNELTQLREAVNILCESNLKSSIQLLKYSSHGDIEGVRQELREAKKKVDEILNQKDAR